MVSYAKSVESGLTDQQCYHRQYWDGRGQDTRCWYDEWDYFPDTTLVQAQDRWERRGRDEPGE
jgi:hypothetical protein